MVFSDRSNPNRPDDRPLFKSRQCSLVSEWGPQRQCSTGKYCFHWALLVIWLLRYQVVATREHWFEWVWISNCRWISSLFSSSRRPRSSTTTKFCHRTEQSCQLHRLKREWLSYINLPSRGNSFWIIRSAGCYTWNAKNKWFLFRTRLRKKITFYFSTASQWSGILNPWIWFALNIRTRSSSPNFSVRTPSTDRSEIICSKYQSII